MVQQLEVVLFFVVSGIAILSALGVVFNRNAVYSALLLLVNFGMLAILYVMLNAQFVAMVQVAIYAGAIVVLFLFVEMLLGASGQTGTIRWLSLRTILIAVAAFVMLTFVGTVLFEAKIGGASGTATPERIAELGQTQAIGLVLFTDYVLAFQLTGILLLVGMIGAIVLGSDWRKCLPDNQNESGGQRSLEEDQS